MSTESFMDAEKFKQLKKIDDATRRVRRAYWGKPGHGLDPSTAQVLVTLALIADEQPEHTSPTELANRLGIPQPAVSASLTKLRNSELIAPTRETEDKRSKHYVVKYRKAGPILDQIIAAASDDSPRYR